MRLLITTQVFPPEVHPSAVMVQELAQAAARQGWAVTVATGFPHHPHGRPFPGYGRGWRRVEQVNGFRLARRGHLIHPSPALGIRALVMASQSAAMLAEGWSGPRPDVVISYGPPLVGPLASALAARRWRARLLTVIYDLYPDILIASGHLRRGLLHRLLTRAEALVYRWSDRILVLSPGFRRTLMADKGVPPEKLVVLPVWLDRQDIVPLPRDNPWRREMGLAPKTFVVIYAGTAGLVSGAEVVLEAARRLAGQPDILFLFVGEGRLKERLRAQAAALGLANVRFLPFQPRERLSEVQATADVGLVTLAPGRGRTSVPSKVLGYMAAARPVIASVDAGCDTAATLREAGCGLVTPSGDGAALAAAVGQYYRAPDVRRRDGRRGRHYFLAHFEKEAVLSRYLHLIADLKGRGESR